MKLVVCLGNPGDECAKNRHNVGFLWADWIVSQAQPSAQFKLESKFNALVCDIKDNKGGRILYVKPQTYMNSSGNAVKLIADFYKITADNIAVIHDDLDIEFGEYKVQKGKGPKIHNGVNSIEGTLETDEFWRVRIGIDNRGLDRGNPKARPETNLQKVAGKRYVLSDFSDEELKELNDKILPGSAGTFGSKF